MKHGGQLVVCGMLVVYSAALADSASPLAPPLPLVSAAGRAVVLADVDGDGRPELVLGTKSGFRLFTGTAFSKESAGVPLDAPADTLAVGDFDGDGRVDLAAAAFGTAFITLVPGDGRGGWLAPRQLPLHGPLTAFGSGDVNRVDLLPDLVVGVMGPDGPELDVYESHRGAWAADPDVVRLPTVATRIVIGELNDDAGVDIAAACGREIVIVTGRARGLRSGNSGAAASISVIAHVRPVVDLAVLPAPSSSRLVLLDDEGRIAVPGAHELKAPAVAPKDAQGSLLLKVDLYGDGEGQLAVIAPQSGRLIVLHADDDAATGWSVRSELSVPKSIATAIAARVNDDALDDVILVGADGVGLASTFAATTYTVNSALDTDDGVCNAANCTLREAINAANANPGPGNDTIQFALGAGTPSITLATPLPLASGVVILGNTGGATRIELNGSGLATGHGLQIIGGSTVRAMVVRGFPGYGISVLGSNNVVAGCYVGTDAAGGGSVAGNALGGISESGSDNVIGGTTVADRNVVSHNGGFGISATGMNATIQGNYVGTNASGSGALGNATNGIAYSSNEWVTITKIGGTSSTPGAPPGNVVSSNGNDGIWVWLASDTGTVIVAGNIIGLNAAGSAKLANAWAGVRSQYLGLVTVGGTTEAHRNVISGHTDVNSGGGVVFANYPADGVRIQGNYIGTNVTGTAPIANLFGIKVAGTYTHTQIGAPTSVPGHNGGNVVSGNQTDGIYLYSSPGNVDVFDTIEGNVVGLNASGTAALANGSYGIEMAGLPGSTIGGATADSRNVVSGNSLGGIYLNGVTNRMTVAGNFVGTDVTGATGLGNGGNGIRVTNLLNPSADIVIGGDVTTPGLAPGNLVSGNNPSGSGAGIWIDGTNAVRVTVRGNIVGLDAAGAARLPNHHGMLLSGPAVVAGGSTAAGRNVVSGNSANGLQVGNGAQVIGNYIGTDLSGTTALRNDWTGIVASTAQIGGNTPIPGTPPGNLISGNGASAVAAVYIADGAATVRGNAIGVGATGFPVPNQGYGVHVDYPGAIIGGPAAGDGNVISGNRYCGIYLGKAAGVLGNFIGTLGDGSTPAPNLLCGIYLPHKFATIGPDTPPPSGTCTAGCNVIHANMTSGIVVGVSTGGSLNDNVRVRANSFAGNGGLGIDLDGDGVTANGANALLDFPVITSSSFDGVATNVAGTQTASFSQGGVTIDLYGSASADPTGYGEGNRWLGSFNCPQGSPCAFAISAPGLWPVLTATATEGFRNETSEFSAARQDLDGDGVEDSADPDLDGDGVANPDDNCPLVANPAQADVDADGHADACDCAPDDPGAFAIAGDVTGLGVGADKATLSWSDVASSAGPVATYAVMRGKLRLFAVGYWPGESCIGSPLTATTIADGTVPALNTGFFYLVRADNVCGKGAWGTQPVRVSGQCP